jgi:hypothetical protein
MTATAPAVPSGQAWARVVNIVGKVTPTFDVDARVSVSNGYAGPLVRISLTGSGDRHEVSVDADDGTLSLVNGTFIGGGVANGTYGKDPLGSVTLDRWFQLHMRVAFSTGAADVTIEIDRNPKFGGQPIDDRERVERDGRRRKLRSRERVPGDQCDGRALRRREDELDAPLSR